MADPIIKLKRSAVYGKIPPPGQLPLGEVALNTYDGYLYASKNVGIGTTVIAINPFRVGTGTDSYNAYFTAGNIGIGSTQPSVALDVVGDAHISGVVTATAFIGGIYIDESEDVMLLDEVSEKESSGGSDDSDELSENMEGEILASAIRTRLNKSIRRWTTNWWRRWQPR